MSTTNFTTGTVITSEFLNDVQDAEHHSYTPAGAGAVATTVQKKLRESVSVKDFGAVGDGVADDTIAIQSALNSGATSIYLPPGNYKYSALVVPSTVTLLYGSGASTILVYSGSLVSEQSIVFNGQTNLIVRDFTINVNSTVYTTVKAIKLNEVSVGVIERIYIPSGGYIAIHVYGGNRLKFRDITIGTFVNVGFYANNSPNYLKVDGVSVTGNGSGHGIQIVGGAYHEITNCNVGVSGQFGINLYGAIQSIISENNCTSGTIEGINIQDCSKVSIIGNQVDCTTGHHDFGISLYGLGSHCSQNLVSSNRVYFPGKSGIALASSASYGCKQNHVEGNLIISPNVLNEAQGAGILLYGSTLCTENTIQNNRLIDEGGKARYGCHEYNDGAGSPNFNKLINNPIITASGLLSQNKKTGANSSIVDVSSELFTPVITSSTGTITTYTASGTYKRLGDFAEFYISINITDNGTGSGYLTATIPITTTGGILSGRDFGVGGYLLSGQSVGSSVTVRKYDNAYPAASGSTIQLSGILKI